MADRLIGHLPGIPSDMLTSEQAEHFKHKGKK